MNRAIILAALFFAIVGCGGAPSTPDNGCPMAEPTQCLSDYSPDAGPEVTQVCTDTSIDDFNCGGCGIKCSGRDSCIDSKCVCVPLTKEEICVASGPYVPCGALPDACGGNVQCDSCKNGMVCKTGPVFDPPTVKYCQ